MNAKHAQSVRHNLANVHKGLVELVVFVALLGLINFLLINQRVVLYLFYIPVVVSAWRHGKRDAVGLATLAALLVVAYAVFFPEKFGAAGGTVLLWTEMAIWGGILVVTAYLISTLRVVTEEAIRSQKQAYQCVLSILSKLIRTVDNDTGAHCARVAGWAVRIGEELNLKTERLEELRVAGLLHDLGKVEVNLAILRKAASLSKEEQQHIAQHTNRGADIVRPAGGMLNRIADSIAAHHERFDGTGHMQLQGEEIPIVARIIAVADAFDALLSDRPYRKGVSLTEAMDAVAASACTHFDPRIVAALQEIVYSDGELAVEQIGQSALI